MSNNLFDRAKAIEARDRAIAQVDEHANSDWKAKAADVVARVARSQGHLTTDDVWARLIHVDAETHEPRALGAIMRAAATHGIIVATDSYVQSTRVACHRRPLRVWRSLVFYATG